MSSEVQSVLRAFDVLRALAAHASPVALATIADETGLPKSTTKRLLATLESINMVERGEAPGEYTLGPGTEVLTGRPTSTAQLVAVAHPYLRELVDNYGEDAGLAVPDGGEVLFAHQVISPNPVQVRDWTGVRFRPHLVAAGHVMMADWATEDLERYLAQPLARQTEHTVTDPGQLRRRVEAAREHGYAWAHEEWAEGINGVAAPIRGPDGTFVGAINVYGPAYRFPGDVEAATARDVVRTAGLVARHVTVDRTTRPSPADRPRSGTTRPSPRRPG